MERIWGLKLDQQKCALENWRIKDQYRSDKKS